MRASTDRGEAHNDFGSPLTVDENNRGATIAGNSGGPQIRLETGRGTVTVRKSSGDEVTFPDIPSKPKSGTPPSAPIKQ